MSDENLPNELPHINENVQSERFENASSVLYPSLTDELNISKTKEATDLSPQRKFLRYSPNHREDEDISPKLSSTPNHFVNQATIRTLYRRKSRSDNENLAYDHATFKNLKPSCKEYFQFLNRYQLGDTLPVFGKINFQIEMRKVGIDCISIGLFGDTGAGKSAFFNSVYYVMSGQYTEYSAERKTFLADESISITDRRLELRLTETITLIDNRGNDNGKPSLNEFSKQCSGLRRLGAIVPDNWNNNFLQNLKDHISKCNKSNLFKHRIHCPIVVCNLMQRFDLQNMKRLVQMLKEACCPNAYQLLRVHPGVASPNAYQASRMHPWFAGSQFVIGITRCDGIYNQFAAQL